MTKVLDHGHVFLLDHMGSDADICAAARTSYQQGTKKVSNDETLLRYLYRNRHTSPFEMAYLKFHVKAPIFVFRQWHRHRTQSFNEVSARYSELPEEYYVPEVSQVCAQSTTNKQGRAETLPQSLGIDFQNETVLQAGSAFETYHDSLSSGVARELARITLPLNTYSEMVFSCNLKNLLDFLALRMDKHAQWEIRQYANAIGEIVKELFPWTWQAFVDYRLNAMTLSAPEIEFLKYGTDILLSEREKTELKEKMQRMGWNNQLKLERYEASE